jgi:hypothetical protein
MRPLSPRWYVAVFSLPILAASTAVTALQLSSDVGINARYTDNATLASANEKDEIITSTRVSGTITENEGPITGNANASLSYIDYLDDTFGEQTYLRLGGSARWVQIRNVLSWTFNDFYSQTQVNSLGGNTPSNTEDLNAANLSGQLTLRPATRHTVSVTPSFSDYYYEKSANDNQQTSISAAWAYQFRPTISMTLAGGYRETVYDSSTTNNDFSSTNLDFGVTVQRARANYSASIGATKVDRDSGTDSDGLSASFSASYKFTDRSRVNASVSTDITDTSRIYLASSLDPNAGNFANVQTTSAVVRNSIARVAYTRDSVNTTFSTWVELRKLEYEQSATSDREVQEVGASLGRKLSPRVSASVNGSYVATDLQSATDTDKYYRANAQLGYSLSRKLSASAGARFQRRDTGNSLSEYDELGFFAGIGYRIYP